ncbi:MAG TPA: hypothetical protein VK031_05350 [Tissierellaceae bacterium]|nr:hypothetical protein [Tissierellaceae bacterium]
MSDFLVLLEAEEEAKKSVDRSKEAIDMLGHFLQFLKTKDYFKDIVEEFNASHNRLSIGVKDNRVFIYLDGEKIK